MARTARSDRAAFAAASESGSGVGGRYRLHPYVYREKQDRIPDPGLLVHRRSRSAALDSSFHAGRQHHVEGVDRQAIDRDHGNLDQPHRRRSWHCLRAVVCGLRGDQWLVDCHHARHRQHHVPGTGRKWLQQAVCSWVGGIRRHTRHHHPALDSADPLRHHDRAQHCPPLRGRYWPGFASDPALFSLCAVCQSSSAPRATHPGSGAEIVFWRHFCALAALYSHRWHLFRVVQSNRSRCDGPGLCAADRVPGAREGRFNPSAASRKCHAEGQTLLRDPRDGVQGLL